MNEARWKEGGLGKCMYAVCVCVCVCVPTLACVTCSERLLDVRCTMHMISGFGLSSPYGVHIWRIRMLVRMLRVCTLYA